MSNVMLDLETLGKKPGCVIAAIGAVRFDRGGILGEFYTVIDVADAQKHGLVVDASTVLWWLEQSDLARKALTQPRREPMPLIQALTAFADWVSKDPTVWGNGAAFDNVILAAAYHACDMVEPWNYTGNRCYRTVRKLYTDVQRITPRIAHHALHDAAAQAEHLIQIQALHPKARIL